MASTADVERVLSIQSHVASGHVGQQASVFPLQLLGYEVDAVNTVNYSNHAGYGNPGGWKSTAEGLLSIFEGMEKNGLLRPSRLVTGYIPNPESLTVISQIIRRLHDQDVDLIYLLDPDQLLYLAVPAVMGDAGKLYVTPDVVPIYRELLPLATIITPNYFEVEVLTGHSLESIASLQQALHVLHLEYQVPHVVISSMPLTSGFFASLPTRFVSVQDEAGTADDALLCIASSKVTSDNSALSTVHAMVLPRIPGYFSGVGDFFSAMVLGHFRTSSCSAHPPHTALSYAVSRACHITHAILSRTHAYSMTLPSEDRTTTDEELDAQDPGRKIRRMKGRELRLVKERDVILRQGHNPDLMDMLEWSEFWA